MKIKKVTSENELKNALLDPSYAGIDIVCKELIPTNPIVINRSVCIMSNNGREIINRNNVAYLFDVSNNALDVTFAGIKLVNDHNISGEAYTGIFVNSEFANININHCSIKNFGYTGVWGFCANTINISNTTIIGTNDISVGHNYGIWQGGKSNVPEQKLVVNNCVFVGSRHAIGSSYHPNSYFVTNCHIDTLKHSFDRHNWNEGGNKGGMNTIITGNTFANADKLAFGVEPPYEGGSFVFVGNHLNHPNTRHIGEIAGIRVYENHYDNFCTIMNNKFQF